jgi:hypothetical protein
MPDDVEDRLLRLEIKFDSIGNRLSEHDERHDKIESTVAALMKRIDRVQWIILGAVLAQLMTSESNPLAFLLRLLA